MFGQSSWLVLHPKTKTFHDYKQEISNLETNLMEQFPQSLFYEFGSGAPCWFSVCQRMIDQEHTVEQEQRSRLRVYRRCLLGEGGPWELLKQAKKPLPWLNLTQTHFLVFHYHLFLPTTTICLWWWWWCGMPVFHHHLLLLILQSSPIPSWLPWMVGTPRYKKTNDDDDDYDNFEEKWWWWKWK